MIWRTQQAPTQGCLHAPVYYDTILKQSEASNIHILEEDEMIGPFFLLSSSQQIRHQKHLILGQLLQLNFGKKYKPRKHGFLVQYSPWHQVKHKIRSDAPALCHWIACPGIYSKYPCDIFVCDTVQTSHSKLNHWCEGERNKTFHNVHYYATQWLQFKQ